jgi:hypothetical protein
VTSTFGREAKVPVPARAAPMVASTRNATSAGNNVPRRDVPSFIRYRMHRLGRART